MDTKMKSYLTFDEIKHICHLDKELLLYVAKYYGNMKDILLKCKDIDSTTLSFLCIRDLYHKGLKKHFPNYPKITSNIKNDLDNYKKIYGTVNNFNVTSFYNKYSKYVK